MIRKISVILGIILLFLVGCKNNNFPVDNKNIEEKHYISVEEYENMKNKIKDLEKQVLLKDNEKYDLKEVNEFLHKEVSMLNDRLDSQGKGYWDEYQFNYYKRHFEPTITSDEAKEIIEKRANKVIKAISDFDTKNLSQYIHPYKGIRFTPYTNVSLEDDLVFRKENISNFDTDKNKYVWGHYDGSGFDIDLTPKEYWDKFVYSKDYINEEIYYNEVKGISMMLENQFAIYHNSIIVEYYYPPRDKDAFGYDWGSIRVVFEKYNDEWYIVGLIHNEHVI